LGLLTPVFCLFTSQNHGRFTPLKLREQPFNRGDWLYGQGKTEGYGNGKKGHKKKYRGVLIKNHG